jgi:hypothetical protein
MSRAKQAAQPKRASKAVPVLGAAGLSLSLAGGANGASATPTADMLWRNTGVTHEIVLGEEPVFDVSLVTFFVFDKERAGTLDVEKRLLAAGCACCQFARAPSFTPGNDAYSSPPARQIGPVHKQVRKRP